MRDLFISLGKFYIYSLFPILTGYVGFFFVVFGCASRCDGLSIFSLVFAAVAICLIPAAILFLLGSKFGYDRSKSRKFTICSSIILHYSIKVDIILFSTSAEFQYIFFTILILNLFVLAWLRSRTYAFFAVALAALIIVPMADGSSQIYIITILYFVLCLIASQIDRIEKIAQKLHGKNKLLKKC